VRANRHVVNVMNANWMAGGEGEDGRFELMIVASPTAMSALVALAQPETVPYRILRTER
jgi:hypothetical protein